MIDASAILWAVITVVFFGSQAVHLKTKIVKGADSPWLLKSFFSLGVAFVGLVLGIITLAQGKNPFSVWGIYTALLWAPGTVLLLFAVSCIGIGLTIGLNCVSASLTSFVVGTVALGNALPRPALAVVAIVCMVLGVMGLAGTAIKGEQKRRAATGLDPSLRATLNASVASRVARHSMPARRFTLARRSSAVLGDPFRTAGAQRSLPARPVEPFFDVDAAIEGETSGIDLIGVLSAVIAGVLYGCQGIFLSHGEELADCTSMMITQLLVLGPIGIVLSLMAGEMPRTSSGTWKSAAAAFLLSSFGGVLFGVGFIGQTFVLNAFGVAVGTPVTQANLVISGMWSIIAFREVTGMHLILAFIISAAVVLIGVGVLAIYA